MSAFGAGVAVGGKFIGGGLTVYVAFRLFVWLCEFIARLWKEHVHRVDEKTALADASIATRLKHLELGQMRDALRIAALERCVGILTNKVRELNPGDASLVDVADILAASLNIVEANVPDDMLDTLRRAT